jgi:hypothetical protein
MIQKHRDASRRDMVTAMTPAPKPTPRGTTRAALIPLVALLAALMLPAAALSARPAPTARVASAPHCGRQAARDAVANSPLGDYMNSIVGDPTDPNKWTVARFFCRDLTGDHRAEMVVEFYCCTADSPTPLAIFRPVAGQWHLSYSWRGGPVIYGLAIHGRTLIETRPVYRPTDSLCCPSGGNHYWSVRWNGHGWTVKRVAHP